MSERGRRRRRGKRKKYMQIVRESEAKMAASSANANGDRFSTQMSDLMAEQIRESLRKESLIRKVFPVVQGTVGTHVDKEEE